MYQEKRHKLIAFFCVAIVLIGGYFTYTHSGKNKMPEVKQIDTTPTTQTVAVNVPIKIPAKPTPPPLPLGTDQFVVSLAATSDDVSGKLLDGEYIKDASAFTTLIGAKVIAPGAYKISKDMTPAQLLQVLRGKPYMKWIVIPPGLRKEEIAALLAPALGWTKKQTTEWITKDTITKPEYIEGVYAPDTYLIPVGEKPVDVTTRLISKFNEGFAPYLPQFTAKNIKWTTALTLASIVQREAANVSDMPLISGILWNRLNQNMMLGVDATLQYIRGNKGAGWWAPITVADKQTDSPYNTYKHTSLPPHPIANPSLQAIDAVLNPTKTDCLYYIHDKNHITHCAATYEEHQVNIQKYLISPAN
ncbi:endolytic transglycosylase MltG [Candidatus Nomurabacteria bacterium]|nr:endolytic transglycosylase MltG [Candidatus Nomurabacteria bacterium]